MKALKLQYIEDKLGKKIAVILPIDDYNDMVEQVEELDDIKAYDAAKASGEKAVPFDKATREIEKARNDL